MKKNQRFFLVTGVIACLVSFGAGTMFGLVYNIRQSVVNESGDVEIKKVIDLYSKTRSEEISFNQFWQIWDSIKKKSANQPVDDVKLFYGAIEGLVSSLEDPYSVYFPPVEAKEFANDLSGEFEGIGAEIGIKENIPTVIAPLPESPSQKAGLRAEDRILTIDGEKAIGLSIDQAVNKIRGPKGTEVVLGILRNDTEELDITIIRDTIVVPTVIWEKEENNLAYMRISYFNGDTWKSFDKAVREIKEANISGIILDLRSNPGGYLETSVDVASEWIATGDILHEKFGNEKTKTHKTRGAHRLSDMPTVVLIDGGTASGSEIVAGALQDYEKAKVLGTTSFGKGSVQDFQVLQDGSALKLTIAKWFTPLHREIEGSGIEPDILVEKHILEDETTGEITDITRQKAIELLLN